MKYFLIFTLLALFSFSSAWGEEAIKFPTDYRATFKNYLSLDRVQNPDQVIRLYANSVALKGPDADGKFPYGSILVAEIYKALKDADGKVVQSKLGRRIRDKFALIAVMQRRQGADDKIPTPLKNDDWDFATFQPDGTPAKKDLNACRNCHAPLVTTHHLFSYEHIK